MTTIAYNHKDKQLAVDSRCCIGNLIHSDTQTKWVNYGDEIWILCGSVSDFKDLVGLSHNDRVDITPNCNAFVILDGKVYDVGFIDGICKWDEVQSNMTLGSGQDFALAAMDFGCNAKESIKYAMTRDRSTGGRVKVFNIKNKRRKE